jgi:hypothetical protein
MRVKPPPHIVWSTDAVDLYFLLQQKRVDLLLALAAQKDPGFDLYWFT